jgi:hypothetical protein
MSNSHVVATSTDDQSTQHFLNLCHNNPSDLRDWTVSARRKLVKGPRVNVQVTSNGEVIKNIPKWAFMLVCPHAYNHFFWEPLSATLLLDEYQPQDTVVNAAAMQTIADWLIAVCRSRGRAFNIPVQHLLRDNLALRQTARAIGMGQYVRHLTAMCCNTLAEIVPQKWHVEEIVRFTTKTEDPVFKVLVQRLVVLRKTGKFPAPRQLKKMLEEDEYKGLKAAIEKAEVKDVAIRAEGGA